MDDIDLSLWDDVDGGGATSPFTRDLKRSKMQAGAAGRLERAMHRVAHGTAKPGEVGGVRNGVLELRVNADKRWYRVLFAVHKGRYVALLLAVKKRNDLDDAWIDAAEERLKLHKKLHP